MDFFNSGFFWFLEGIIFCVVLIGFKAWMKDRGVSMNLWKWVASSSAWSPFLPE